MRKVNLKNLRVNGNRVPQSVWDRVAEIMLPGPEPSEADKKHGKSKSAVLKRIVATDATRRKQALQLCAEFMSADALADAKRAGWIPEAAPKTDGIPRCADGSIDWVARLEGMADYRLSEAERTALFKAHQDGITDPWEKERLMQEARKAAGIVPPPSAIMLCGICSAPATRQLPKGLHTDKLGDYCDKHDWRGGPQIAAHPAAFTFGNTAIEVPEPRTPWSDGRPMRGPQSLSGFAQ